MALLDGAGRLIQGSDELLTGVSSLKDGGRELASGVAELSSGGKDLLSGTSDLQEGSHDLLAGAGDLRSGGAELLTGSISLVDGISKLSEGAYTAGNASLQLWDGSLAVRDNLLTLREGVETAMDGGLELHDGSIALYDGLSDGLATIDESLVNDSNTMAEFIAQPGQVISDTYGDPGYFGGGFAPLFMTLGLWLGSLMIFFLLDPFPLELNQGRIATVLGRLPACLFIGFLEVLGIFAVVNLLGLPCTNVPLMLIFFLVISLTFILLMQCLHLLCGNLVGKAVAIILLVLQLAASSGTMPVELSGSFIQSISSLLPVTYAIDGFRELMTGGNFALVYNRIFILLAYAFGFLVLSLLSYPLALDRERKARQKSKSRLEQWEALDSASV